MIMQLKEQDQGLKNKIRVFKDRGQAMTEARNKNTRGLKGLDKRGKQKKNLRFKGQDQD
jgi:hypothetical protein